MFLNFANAAVYIGFIVKWLSLLHCAQTILVQTTGGATTFFSFFIRLQPEFNSPLGIIDVSELY